MAKADQLEVELPPDFTFSQASLQDYSDCPRRFQLRYIANLAWPAIESEPVLDYERALQDGNLFHRLIQQHRLGIDKEKLEKLSGDGELSTWWQNYMATDLRIDNMAQYAELSLTASIAEAHLLAKYDLVAASPGQRIVIYDWKTSRKRPRDEWMAARLQTRVYRALLVKSGSFINAGNPVKPEQVEMIYWYANFPGEPARFRYDEAQFTRDWDALTGMIQEITHRGEFPLTEDEKKCTFCTFRSYCNRGVKAGKNEGSEEDHVQSQDGFDLNFEQVAEIEF